jgi:hypothetical protein
MYYLLSSLHYSEHEQKERILLLQLLSTKVLSPTPETLYNFLFISLGIILLSKFFLSNHIN